MEIVEAMFFQWFWGRVDVEGQKKRKKRIRKLVDLQLPSPSLLSPSYGSRSIQTFIYRGILVLVGIRSENARDCGTGRGLLYFAGSRRRSWRGRDKGQLQARSSYFPSLRELTLSIKFFNLIGPRNIESLP